MCASVWSDLASLRNFKGISCKKKTLVTFVAMSCGRKEYRIGAQLSICEDKQNEFKGHKNFCVEDLPKWAFVKGTLRRSRKAISR